MHCKFFIIKYNSFITKSDSYYKTRCLLQNASVHSAKAQKMLVLGGYENILDSIKKFE